MPPLVLDVWADISCPWCWMGRRRLTAAVAQEEPGSVLLHHRAFELAPDLPSDGLPIADVYGRRFKTPEALLGALTTIAEAAQPDGIVFAFDRMQRAPNTRLAHRVVKVVESHGPAHAEEALEALYRGHFQEGADLSDAAQLLALVEEATGVVITPELLAEGAGLDEVVTDEAAAAQIGFAGVPFLLAGRKYALTGAQDADVLRDFLTQAREKLAVG